MDEKVIPTTITIAIVLLAFVGMWVGWRRRTRSQDAELAPLPALPSQLGDVVAQARVLYAATTRLTDPLDRITARGLGFRAHGEVFVHPKGVVIERAGAEPLFIVSESLLGAEAADWTIDKGVERGGLIAVHWAWGEFDVTTFLRPREASDGPAVIAAVNALTPPPSAERRSRELMF